MKTLDKALDEIAEDSGCAITPLCRRCPLPCSCEDLAPREKAKLHRMMQKGTNRCGKVTKKARTEIISWMQTKIPWQLREYLMRGE